MQAQSLPEPIESSPVHPSMTRTILRASWNALLAMIGAYGLSLSGFILLRALVGEGVMLVAMLNNMLHLMLLPALLLLPFALVIRRWQIAGFVVLPFALAVQSYVLPPVTQAVAAPPDADGIPITVLTYNLLGRMGGFEESLAIIREADADIVALQEVGYPTAEALTVLVDEYPYMALHPHPHPTVGQAILSRYPITDSEFFQHDLPIRLGHQRAELDIDGQTVVVYNVHPVHPLMGQGAVRVRADDIGGVLDRAAPDADQFPVLVVGDFNLTDQTGDYIRIRDTFNDVYRQRGAGLGYTFPDTSRTGGLWGVMPPLARIDYIFHDDDWLAWDARVWDRSGGSDHRPLWGELRLLAR